MADVHIKDRSLEMTQGTLESGGHGVSNLPKLLGEEYHQPEGHPSEEGSIAVGPRGLGSSAYKAEGTAPTVARMQGHSVVQTSGAAVASLDKGSVRQQAAPGGVVTPAAVCGWPL